jgi:hypothetical protein
MILKKKILKKYSMLFSQEKKHLTTNKILVLTNNIDDFNKASVEKIINVV